MHKKIYCTLDTETIGGCTRPEGFYQISGLIHDRLGNVFATFNFLIASMFEKIRYDNYGKKNFSLYQEMIAEGVASMVDTEETALKIISDLCDFYGVTTMTAFNAVFDFRKTKAEILLDGREYIDIYLAALETLGKLKKYANFCRENNRLSASKKSISGTAESFYAFLTDNPRYKEEHTAFQDAKIEKDILMAVINSHRRYTQNMVFYDYPDKRGLCVPARA